MKISIITVVYNNEKTVEQAIESVLSQTYKNKEYIVIDGSSTDRTLSIIKKHKDKISQIVSESDNGIYDAMNKGIMMAMGDIIGILNSDDLYNDMDVLNDVTTCFNNDPELDIIYGDLVYVKNDDTNKVVRNWISKSYYPDFFENGNVPPHPTLFLRSRVYKEVGLFNLQYKLAADYEFMLRIFKKHNFKSLYINRLMVTMRLGGASNQSLENVIKGNKEILQAWSNNNLKVPFMLMPFRIYKRLLQFFV